MDTGHAVVVGLISDTHAVFEEAVTHHFRNARMILHAGDIGHHGGSQAVLHRLQCIAPVTAVGGNTDDDAAYPAVQVLEINGWQILVTHIVGKPPKVTPAAAALVALHRPDVVVFGHSHTYCCREEGGVLYLNPGSAGPARFKLGRSFAVMKLPPKGSGQRPTVTKMDLSRKAPPRITAGAADTTSGRSCVSTKQGGARRSRSDRRGYAGWGGSEENERGGGQKTRQRKGAAGT